MKPSERRNVNVNQPRNDHDDGGGANHVQDDAWFDRPDKMTQEEERSFLKYMSSDIDNDPAEQVSSQPDSEGVFNNQ